MRAYIWKLLLDADLNSRYWKELAERYSSREKKFKIFLAIMASGTVATWGIWDNIPILWKLLSGISAILSIALPILNYPEQIKQMSCLSGQWAELRIKYEQQWVKIRNISDSNKIDKLVECYNDEQVKLEELESTLPKDVKLLKKCQSDVLASRGLKNKKEK